MPRTNWKKIAITLAKDVEFALGNLRPVAGFPGGFLYSKTSGSMRHWTTRFADSLDQIPGVKVDRVALRKIHKLK